MRPKSHKKSSRSTPLKVNVYLIENKKNKKRYVGITYHSLEKRWKQHLYEALGLNKRRHLYSSIRKYGEKNFELKLIKIADSWKQACQLETHYINKLNSLSKNGQGYNLTTGGDGVLGYQPTKEEIARSIAEIKRVASERNELLRPAVEQLMKEPFINFSKFAERMNNAEIPTLKGEGEWGITKVKNLLKTLGYNMEELEAIAQMDKKNIRHIKATIEKSKSFYGYVKPAVKKIMAKNPDSLRKVMIEFENKNIPSPSGKKWHKTTTKKMLNYLGYDVEGLIRNGLRKIPKPRKVSVDGVLYESVKKAENATGYKHIQRDVRRGRAGFYYLDEGQRPKPPRKKRRPPTKVSVKGKIYDHAAAAGRALGLKPDTITNRCYSPNFPDHFFVEEDCIATQ